MLFISTFQQITHYGCKESSFAVNEKPNLIGCYRVHPRPLAPDLAAQVSRVPVPDCRGRSRATVDLLFWGQFCGLFFFFLFLLEEWKEATQNGHGHPFINQFKPVR